MDPLSITAGTIGIAGTAITSIVQLHSLIDGLAEAKDLVHDATSNLGSIEHAIAALDEIHIADETTSTAAKRDLEKAGVADAVNKLGVACDDLNKKLTKWTRHSTPEKFSLRDRVSVGVWNKEKIRGFETQLQSCKSTVQLAVSSTQLRVQLRSEKLSEEDRVDVRTRLQAIGEDLRLHLELSKQQLVLAQARKTELLVEPDDEEDEGAQRALAIKEVEHSERVLEDFQVSSGTILTQVGSTLSNLMIGDVVTSTYSVADVGLPESVVGKINMRIGNVTTTDHSKSRVGVFKNDVKVENAASGRQDDAIKKDM